MATTERAPTAFIFTNNANQASDIAVLRAAIQPGKKIFRSDINALVTLINNMLGHYHSYTDYYQAATFGVGYGDNPGAGDRTTYSGTITTFRASGVPNNVAQIPLGSTINAPAINAGLSAVRALGSHSHAVVDQTTR